mmetsp:Transcript_23279/g.49578  ORF Transcript_23279/g.49578 Transcript_23279/m.49578 type:complete len:555 (+) Transcript_23279:2706-4370(+)
MQSKTRQSKSAAELQTPRHGVRALVVASSKDSVDHFVGIGEEQGVQVVDLALLLAQELHPKIIWPRLRLVDATSPGPRQARQHVHDSNARGRRQEQLDHSVQGGGHPWSDFAKHPTKVVEERPDKAGGDCCQGEEREIPHELHVHVWVVRTRKVRKGKESDACGASQQGQSEHGDGRAQEAPPGHLPRPERGGLLPGEHDSPYGRAESGCQASCSSGGDDLPVVSIVLQLDLLAESLYFVFATLRPRALQVKSGRLEKGPLGPPPVTQAAARGGLHAPAIRESRPNGRADLHHRTLRTQRKPRGASTDGTEDLGRHHVVVQQVRNVVAVQVSHHERDTGTNGLRREELHQESRDDHEGHTEGRVHPVTVQETRQVRQIIPLQGVARQLHPLVDEPGGGLGYGIRAGTREQSRPDSHQVLHQGGSSVTVKLLVHEPPRRVVLPYLAVNGLEVERLSRMELRVLVEAGHSARREDVDLLRQHQVVHAPRRKLLHAAGPAADASPASDEGIVDRAVVLSVLEQRRLQPVRRVALARHTCSSLLSPSLSPLCKQTGGV